MSSGDAAEAASSTAAAKQMATLLTCSADDIDVRLATPDEAPCVSAVEVAAARVFTSQPGLEWLGSSDGPDDVHISPTIALQRAQQQRLWVAVCCKHDAQIVGFATCSEINGYAHLDEIDVLPGHARRGIGTRLLHCVVAWARLHGLSAVSLTTFPLVPWNGPWYRACGFRDVPDDADMPCHLDDLLNEEEQMLGLKRTTRVAMIRSVSP